jgi:diguanylate cyclase (GGDEF)-like protein
MTSIDDQGEFGDVTYVLPRHHYDERSAGENCTNLLEHGLGALLQAKRGHDPFAVVFARMRGLFDFERAMVLVDASEQECVRCIAAMPGDLVGQTWAATEPWGRGPDPAALNSSSVAPWRTALEGIFAPDQPVLFLPLVTRNRTATMVLSRARGERHFDQGEMGLAQPLALLASTALALQRSDEIEEESRELQESFDRLRDERDTAQRRLDLLHAVIDVAPVGFAVEDAYGRPVLVNAAARSNADMDADGGRDRLPDLASRRVTKIPGLILRQDGEADLLPAERCVPGAAGERTMLTWRTTFDVLGESLRLSTSLDITVRKQLENDLARRAYMDGLTGLPNRTLIQEHLENVLRGKNPSDCFALAFLDLDNFKHINDYYSHAIGDALLAKVAQRISSRLRGSDMLARISGDEFVLLLDPLENADQLWTTIDHILEALKQPFYIEGYEVFTSASVGMSMHPDHGRTYEALRRNADSAMYRVKAGNKGRAALFDREMQKAVTARMELEQRLRWAIRDRQFRCAFQPKVDLRTQEVIGFEALVRWCDDSGVIQAPSDFVGLAIELGLIDEVTRFMLSEAVNAIEFLDDVYGPATTMSVNIAARQANNPTFMRALSDLLRSSPYARRFIFELTEDAFVAKGQFQTEVLPILRDIGIGVSIDDFGTGYSSLSALADITADEIKIDRSFVTAIHQRPRSQSVLKAIEWLSQALGITVIAEGVETYEELVYLQSATHIRYAQGYYFSKPFFLEDFTHQRSLSDNRAVPTVRQIPGRRSPLLSRTTGLRK